MKVDIKPIDASYAKDSWKLRYNNALWEYIENEAPHPATIESETEYFERVSSDPHNSMFAILYEGIFVGYVSLKNISYGSAELSCCVMRQDLWGKGIASRAVSLALQYAYEELKLDLVYLHVNPKNILSYRDAIKKHFVHVGGSVVNPETKRLEITRTKWENILK